MITLLYVSGIVAALATLRTITCRNAIHALLYFIVSLFGSALMFYALGAPFVAALEVITYAGAIMVLFVFVVMLLNVGTDDTEGANRLRSVSTWVGPGILSGLLFAELMYVLFTGEAPPAVHERVAGGATPKEIGELLFGPYVIAVELASMLLLAGLVGAYHLGRELRGNVGVRGER